MGTRNNAGECAALESLTFPSQVLPCSGSTGVISASQFNREAPRDMYLLGDLPVYEYLSVTPGKSRLQN